jgi:hypothetical protein
LLPAKAGSTGTARTPAPLDSHGLMAPFCPCVACALLQPVPNVRNPAMMLEAEDFAKVIRKYKRALRVYAARVDSALLSGAFRNHFNAKAKGHERGSAHARANVAAHTHGNAQAYSAP